MTITKQALSEIIVQPERIRLEASSVCQLRCPPCPNTTKAIHPVIGKGVLKFHNFKKLVDENPWIKEIELSSYGEIFLNPDLLEIIKYAYKRNVVLKALNGVNLNKVSDDVLEGLVKYKFHSMSCSIDGVSHDTYKMYRINGNFNSVIENIRKINHFKKQYQSKYPLMNWQFVVFGHNEHEISLAKKFARDLNMEFYPKLPWDDSFSPIKDREFVRKEVGVNAASRKEYKQKYGVEYVQSMCYQLWGQPQINWDGKILGCCENYHGVFGANAFNDGLLQSINSEKIQYARGMVLGQKAEREDIPCRLCYVYQSMKADGKWLEVDPSILRELERLVVG